MMVAEWKNVSYGVMLASYSLNVEKKAEEAWNSRRIRPQQIQLEITVDGKRIPAPVEVGSLPVYPIIYKVLASSQVVVWDF